MPKRSGARPQQRKAPFQAVKPLPLPQPPDSKVQPPSYKPKPSKKPKHYEF